MTNSKPLFRLSDSENALREQFLQPWRREMQKVYSAEPEADRLIAIFAAADLLEETIREAFKDSATAEKLLIPVDTLRSRIFDVKRNAAA